jgi:L-lactate dehydrogenase complex protein LldG
MSATSGSRDQVLGRIKAATARVSSPTSRLVQCYAAIPRDYVRAGELSADSKIALLCERLGDYGADVQVCSRSGLAGVIIERLSSSGRRVFLVPPDLPREWMAPAFEWKIDHGLGYEEIESADGVVTSATCAIADSGTIVLHHSTREGRRVLTLLPDWQLCIVCASQVVETLPEYFKRVEGTPALVTWISGPSATADIEMTRIKGVHGPRYLNVIIVRDEE